jgi:hypothetical protein
VHFRRLIYLVPFLALAAGACGGGGSSSPGSAPPAAGYASPAAAAVGFLDAISQGNGQGACAYVEPAQVAGCRQVISAVSATITGLRIGQTTTNGNQALVTVLGKICVKTAGNNSCSQNVNPKAGQPTSGSAAFSTAYKAAMNSSSVAADPAAPMTSVGGRWYANFGA